MYEQNPDSYDQDSLKNSNSLCFTIENLQYLEETVLKSSIIDKMTEEVI